MSTRSLLFLFAAACVASLLAGCHAAPLSAPPLPNPRGVVIFKPDGARATWAEMLAATDRANAVLIGENHGHPLGLASAAAFWEDVLARWPSASLSLEFFERDSQPAVDDYLAGLIDEPTFRSKDGRNESNYPDGHRSMVEAAKSAGRPVIASNAPRVYVRVARTEGFDRLAGLTPDQRRLFRVPEELPTGPYRVAFDEIMNSMRRHGNADAPPEAPEAAAKRLDAAFRSQSLWDWTMAESIVRGLDRGDAPVVHVVGRFHSDNDGGLAQALRRMRPGVRIMTVSYVDADASALRDEDRSRADFVVYVGPGPGE